MTKLVATTRRNRYTIHHHTCHMGQRGNARPWPPGDTRTPQQLAIDAARLGFRPCRTCKPFPQPDPRHIPGYRPPISITLGPADAQIGFV